MTAAYCAAPVTQPMRLSNASLDVQRYPICRNLRNLWDNMNRAAEQPEPNPLREGLSTRPVPQPCNIVIFGATGDLTHRKLIPALYNLAADGDLPPSVAIVGFARRKKSDDEFRSDLEKATRKFSRQAVRDEIWKTFAQSIFYHQSEFGKETAQNILVLRFANAIFSPLWNTHYVDHMQITAAETLGVGTRAGFYERAGALRDMVQNHLLQLLCLVAMEPPTDLDADSIRDEKVKVVRSLRRWSRNEIAANVVRGQYTEGAIHGDPVVGYRQEQNVNPDSQTETFVALRLFIDDWRWADVPVYMRVGKRLPKSATEISIHFK